MKKFFIILCIILSIIILALCIEKFFYNSIILVFKYDYFMWCDSEERNYIKEKYGITENYNIIACKVSWNREEQNVYKIKELPYGIGQRAELPSALSDYVRENNNLGEVIIKSVLPYTIIGIVCIALIIKMLKYNKK